MFWPIYLLQSSAQNNLDEKQSCYCGWPKVQDVQQPRGLYSGDSQAQPLWWRHLLLQSSQWPWDCGDRMQIGGERYDFEELMYRLKWKKMIWLLPLLQNPNCLLKCLRVAGEEEREFWERRHYSILHSLWFIWVDLFLSLVVLIN